jgi:hypothetical protein
MSVRSGFGVVVQHGMRAYYIALLAGALLIAGAFLPWIVVAGIPLGGVPEIAGLWVLGLGMLAVLFAVLSIWTRRNSRHPLLVVGLMALGILVIAFRLMRRSAAEQAWAASHALEIVDGIPAGPPPATEMGAGLYVGLTGAILLVLFGLTIVIRRVRQPYPEPEDDDV